MSSIITPDVVRHINAFCAAFSERWMFQPPEFTDARLMVDREWWRAFGHAYEADYGDIANPANTGWATLLIRTGTHEDLVALKRAFCNMPTSNRDSKAIYQYMMYAFFMKALNAEGVSPAVTEWLRKALSYTDRAPKSS